MDPSVSHSTIAAQKLKAVKAQEESDDSISDNEVDEELNQRKTSAFAASGRASTGEELKAKLAAKIAALQQKRTPSAVNKKSANAIKLGQPSKTLKNRDEIIEERKMQKAARKKQIKADKFSIASVPSTSISVSFETKKRPADAEIVVDGTITFGKVEFGANDNKKQRLDPKSALAKVEQKQKRLEELKETNESKAAQIEESQKWTKLTALANGERIMDDTKSIKKAIKKMDHRKKKSASEWQDHADKLKEAEEVKQKKRTQNIQSRKDEKLSRKRGIKPAAHAKKGNPKPKAKAGFK